MKEFAFVAVFAVLFLAAFFSRISIAEQPPNVTPGSIASQTRNAPSRVEGRALWNVIDADQPEKLDGFKAFWKSMKKRLEPAIE